MRSFGVLVLVFGLIWMMSVNGFWLPQKSFGQVVNAYWPLVLVWLGALGLRRREGKSFGQWLFSNGWGLFLILIGAGLILENLDVVHFTLKNAILPLALILLGLFLIFGKSYRPNVSSWIQYDWKEEDYRDEHGNWNWSKKWAGDIKLGGADFKLEDMRIEQALGSIRLDLQETYIPEGETTLEVLCKAGEIEVLVPDGLAVSVEAGVKLGDVKVFTQRTSGSGKLKYASEQYDEAERKVKLKISCKVGDVRVQRVG